MKAPHATAAATLERDDIAQKVCGQHEREDTCDPVLLDGAQRDGPERVPRVEPPLREREGTRRQPEACAAAKRLEQQDRVDASEAERERHEHGAMAEAGVAEELRKPERAGRARLAGKPGGGGEPVDAVPRGRAGRERDADEQEAADAERKAARGAGPASGAEATRAEPT